MTEKSRKQKLLAFLEADPADSFSRYALGLEHLAEGEPGAALGAFEEVRSRDPRYVAVYYQLGKTLQALGRLEEARSAFQEGLTVASAAKDWHTHDELQAALDELA